VARRGLAFLPIHFSSAALRPAAGDDDVAESIVRRSSAAAQEIAANAATSPIRAAQRDAGDDRRDAL